MIHSRRLALVALGAAVILFPAAAKANFCNVTGGTAQEIAANVVKSKDFARIGGNARFVGYFNKKAMVRLAVTRPGNKAHPAVACLHFTRKTGDWQAWTTIKCEASRSACNALLDEFKILEAQWQALGKANKIPNP